MSACTKHAAEPVRGYRDCPGCEVESLRQQLAAAQAELAREKSPETSFTETGTARLLPNGRLGCLDCGAEYGGPRFPDLVLPHDVWAKISPNGDEGGLLCPCCINARLAAAGISNVFGRFVSGPLAIDPEPSAVVDLIKDAIHLAAEAGKSSIHAKLCEALDLLAIRDAEARELRALVIEFANFTRDSGWFHVADELEQRLAAIAPQPE